MEENNVNVVEETSMEVIDEGSKFDKTDLLKAGGVIGGTILVWELGKKGFKWIGKKIAPTAVGKKASELASKVKKQPKEANEAAEQSNK